MLDVATNYYEDLYREKPIDVSLWSSLFDGLPKLGVQDRALLDCEITVKECLDALRSMPDGKTPGDDGIPTETWRVVFPLIGSQYVKMLNIAKEKGRFKPDFLRALLTLLKKKNKFDGQMKDFRPLSLMNIDYKILSKVLSTRLRKVLGNIIHQDQTCSIPGRAIHDNIYLIRSIIDYQQRIRDPIGLILWDQEKAFDRVNHRYLVGVLEAFGFGSEFISWVKLLYANGSFRIKINNSISIPISFNSGVRQGCSLSGGLFIISLEPLLHRIRSNQAIPGILPPGGQYSNIRQVVLANKNNINPDHVRIKTIAYADDNNEPSIYWQLINRQYFRRPICEVRNPHLKDISFFRLLRESLPNRQLDFWLLLANFGIHTRSRLGHNDISRQCLLCPAVETPAHLFINCPILVGLFDILNNRIQSICGHKLNKAIMDVVYLKEILQMSPNRLTRRNMVFLIGCYLHTIWTFRNVVRHQCHQHQGLDPCIAARQFLAATKHLPFDNG
ncbi:unnamed protein product [Rotaria socialis]|uniref:Reverse transcriptase domain-containing protein n=1 Tax=Rotaria socialis TaxID=392032 RepID=A0A820Z8B4_9BILA|nr:unnamed protein product [Rotaria socialis]